MESPTDLEMKAAAAHRHGDLLLLEAACVRLVGRLLDDCRLQTSLLSHRFPLAENRVSSKTE